MDKDLREMFYNLQDGLSALNKKVNNPICRWSKCRARTFDCISTCYNTITIKMRVNLAEHALSKEIAN